MKLNLNREALLDVLESIEIDVDGETGQDFIAYCPFHINKDSAALNVGKDSPYPFRCWNTACGVSGTLLKLVEMAGHMTPMQALRHVFKYAKGLQTPLVKLIADRDEEAPYEIWPEERLERVKINWNLYNPAAAYMIDERGFTRATCDFFEIGYSQKKHRVVIPVRDETGGLVGFSGRAIEPDQEPRYWDKGLPKKHLLFNLNIAQAYKQAIVTEGPLDAMKVYQAGYRNVVAILGGGFSKEQREKLTRFFSSCIIFTDNPEVDVSGAGAVLANKIAEVMRKAGREVYAASYPQGKKDPGELSEQEIKIAIENSESILRLKLRLGGIK